MGNHWYITGSAPGAAPWFMTPVPFRPAPVELSPENEKETKQAAIERAWAGAMELADSAWKRFEKTSDTLAERPLSAEKQQEVNKEDPAYVQLFALDWSESGEKRIRRVLDRLANRANADPGANGRPGELESAIDINCQDTWKEEGQDQCDKTLAFTENKYHPTDETKNANSIMNFCKRFWSLPRYDRLKAAAQVKDTDEAVDKDMKMADYYFVRRTMYEVKNNQNTDAGTVLHEISHIFWIGPTNLAVDDCEDDVDEVDEVVKLFPCARRAWKKGSPIPNNPEVTWNADSYTNYAEYGRFVELLGYDPWPENTKPVKLPARY
ncbi:hypothetical protein N7492_002142 [Penicillium capsulatum]|uniref:Lysine-specific metallo-endopeptidase domain-containing protein n=1 Tax=Penicillium capsulatum TaxID=69766 RepID=A0A9W9IJH9_9EURO|nr:hypothetical protein N7492_002142 [Penicillium capsulatum]